MRRMVIFNVHSPVLYIPDFYRKFFKSVLFLFGLPGFFPPDFLHRLADQFQLLYIFQ